MSRYLHVSKWSISIVYMFYKGGASPYYFGTTNLWCMMKNEKGKRDAPWRSTIALTHRFIYYKGYYFDFLSKYKT